MTAHNGGPDLKHADAGHLTYKDLSNCLSTKNQRNDYETETFIVETEATGYDEYAFHMTQDPISGDVSPCLGTTTNGMSVLEHKTKSYKVRRLTPRECERLMGWPDDHTRYDDKGNELSDSARYKMCGNGIASPVARWIGENIVEAYDA